MSQALIEVVLDNRSIPAELHGALQRANATASFRPLADVVRTGFAAQADAVVIVTADESPELAQRLRILFHRLTERPRATLVLLSGTDVPAAIAHPATLPVCVEGALTEAELAARLSTMLSMRHCLHSLHERAAARRGMEQRAARRYQNQLKLASQVQREFLPVTLPRFGRVSFATVFRPADYVSGDIYDVRRLDEDHVGIAVADATGHGIPAALLTVFVKRAMRGKEIYNGSYRILGPDEVLTRLNEDLIEADLSNCRFVAAAYAVLNIRTYEARIARGGVPYPIVRRADGTAELIRSEGSVVGVLPDATFASETVQLEPGDSLLLLTDGVEKLVAPHASEWLGAGLGSRAGWSHRGSNAHDDEPLPSSGVFAASTAFVTPAESDFHDGAAAGVAVATLAPPDECVRESPWFGELRTRGVSAALERLSARFDTLRRIRHPLDDVTVVAVQIGR
ncbi:MAG: PP2C family protein-serine/threonine phosphatase [Phycisphaerae bacterium]